MRQTRQGLFISIDGPNGVGKSTFVDILSKRIQCKDNLFLTKEPTKTDFGYYVKKNEGHLSGLPYAFLISADRCYQIENEVIPHLENGQIVISDRYIESSIVCQGYDGVALDRIWDLNKYFPIPDISILLMADEEIIERRLSQREILSAFERKMSRHEEVQRYYQAKDFLEKKGFRYHICKNNNMRDLEQSMEDIINHIDCLQKRTI